MCPKVILHINSLCCKASSGWVIQGGSRSRGGKRGRKRERGGRRWVGLGCERRDQWRERKTRDQERKEKGRGLRRENDRDLATTDLEGRGDAEARTSKRDEDDENEEKSIVRASRGPVRLTIALGLGS